MSPIRCILLLLLVVLLTIPSALPAQQLTARFGTSIYTWERFDTVGTSRTITRGYETMFFSLSEGDISLQAAGTGAVNLSGSPFGQQGEVRISNAFLRWRNMFSVADLSLGRVPVFAGVGNGLVDGGLLRVGSKRTLAVTAYGGANVQPDLVSVETDDLKENLRNNFFVGAQITGGLLRNDVRFSLSYMNRRQEQEGYFIVRPDTLFNPVRSFITPEPRSQQLAGIDLRYDNEDNVSLYGRYEYDFNFTRMYRAELFGRFPLTSALAITGNYLYRQQNILYNSYFGIFPFHPTNEYEGGLEYAFAPSVWVYGKAAYVDYLDDKSQRYTVGVNSPMFALSGRGSAGYAGELLGVDAEFRYPLFERRVIPSAQVGYASYKLSRYDTDRQSVFSAAGGGSIRILQSLTLHLQAQWLNNPFFKSDVRFFGRLDFWLSENLGLFGRSRGGDMPHD